MHLKLSHQLQLGFKEMRQDMQTQVNYLDARLRDAVTELTTKIETNYAVVQNIS